MTEFTVKNFGEEKMQKTIKRRIFFGRKIFLRVFLKNDLKRQISQKGKKILKKTPSCFMMKGQIKGGGCGFLEDVVCGTLKTIERMDGKNE